MLPSWEAKEVAVRPQAITPVMSAPISRVIASETRLAT
jgi:hypothetical protein